MMENMGIFFEHKKKENKQIDNVQIFIKNKTTKTTCYYTHTHTKI